MFRVFRERQREVVPDDSLIMPNFNLMYNDYYQKMETDSFTEDVSACVEPGDSVHPVKKEEDILVETSGDVRYDAERMHSILPSTVVTARNSSPSACSNSPLEKIRDSHPAKKEEFVLAPHDDNGGQGELEEGTHLPQTPLAESEHELDRATHDVHVVKVEDELCDTKHPMNSDTEPAFDEGTVVRCGNDVVEEQEADYDGKVSIGDHPQLFGVGLSKTVCNGEAREKQPMLGAISGTKALSGSKRLSVEEALSLFPMDDLDNEELALRLGLMTWMRNASPHSFDAMACKFCATSEELCSRMRVYCWPYLVDQMLQHLWREHAKEWQEFEQLDRESRKTYFEGRLAPKKVIEDRIEKMECVQTGMVRGETKMKFGVEVLRKERMRLQQGEGEEGGEFRRWKTERRAASKRLRERKRQRGEVEEGGRNSGGERKEGVRGASAKG